MSSTLARYSLPSAVRISVPSLADLAGRSACGTALWLRGLLLIELVEQQGPCQRRGWKVALFGGALDCVVFGLPQPQGQHAGPVRPADRGVRRELAFRVRHRSGFGTGRLLLQGAGQLRVQSLAHEFLPSV